MRADRRTDTDLLSFHANRSASLSEPLRGEALPFLPAQQCSNGQE